MSSGILQALMHLFAILGAGNQGDDNLKVSRGIVAMFLRQQLNKELVDEYMEIYEGFIDKYRRRNKNGKQAKRASLSSVKVLRICTRINEELAQKEKYFVVLRLLEFITSFENVSKQDWEFLDLVTETFNIENSDYQNLIQLVNLEEGSGVLDVENTVFLVVDNKKESSYSLTKHIYAEGMEGTIVFVHIADENMFLFRYFGKRDLSLNGQSMIQNRSYLFLQGATIRGARIMPLYYSAVIFEFIDLKVENTIEFRAENCSYYFSKKKQALHQFNLVEHSANLIGIMGGSGSGKSTMLNVLNGNYNPTYGKVTINGIDIHKCPEKIKGSVGFVSQDDLLIEELSVFQNLYFSAKLTFGNKSEEELIELVDSVLKSIGLFEVKELKVGSPLVKTISGGQRKRLNIALELIREPAILFVDEPTSGLSSRDSENIMDLLKELTYRGKLIFVVIHQPSSNIFKMFDKLFILDAGGFPVYYGNPVESVVYFKKLVNHVNHTESECTRCGNVNPEQIFDIIEAKIVDEYGRMTEHRKITPREWNNFFNVIIGNHIKTSVEQKELPKNHFSIPNKLKQLKVFFRRDVLSKLSNKQYVFINLIEAPLLALILSFFIKFSKYNEEGITHYVFRENDNITQYIFISVIVMLFLGLTVSAEEIIKDREILKREKFLNLSEGSYLTSKIVIMLFISAVQSLLFVIVGNGILGIKGMWFAYWIMLFSTASFANLLGLNISASFNSAKVIYIMIPILIIPQLIFSGVIVKFDKLNPIIASQSSVPWIGNVMASRWAFEALAVFQFKNNDYEKAYFETQKRKSEYRWKKDFWIGEISDRISDIKQELNADTTSVMYANNISLVKIELEKEMKVNSDFQFDYIDKLNVNDISIDVLDQLEEKLSALKDVLRYQCNAEFENVDIIRYKQDSILKEQGSSLVEMQSDFYNEHLKKYVTNSDELINIVEYKGELIQKTYPIYNTPHHKSFFGAHFLAPTKNFYGRQIETYIANLVTIWGMVLLLTIALFFNWFRITLDVLGKIPKLLNIRFNFLDKLKRLE